MLMHMVETFAGLNAINEILFMTDSIYVFSPRLALVSLHIGMQSGLGNKGQELKKEIMAGMKED